MKLLPFKSQSKITDAIISIFFLSTATLISWLFFTLIPENNENISLIYILALVLTARFTSGYLPGIFASIICVICVNFLFTYPYLSLNFQLSGYPLSFVVMLAISVTTSAATTHLKQQSIVIAEREQLLIEAEKEKMRANLLRAVSHDLRTPLTSIIGSSAAYLENETLLDTEDKKELVTHIFEDSNWLLNMVENLLSVTRIHDESTTVTKSLEPVEEVLAEAVYRLRKRIPDAQINVHIPDELLMIPMDAILIEQVLINLLENAVVHSASKKPINCSVNTSDQFVYFHVRDFGVGISPQRMHHLFDFSASIGSDVTDIKKGMGIGLTICKTIVSVHGGTIEAKNHRDGAEFIFNLPKEDPVNES